MVPKADGLGRTENQKALAHQRRRWAKPADCRQQELRRRRRSGLCEVRLRTRASSSPAGDVRGGLPITQRPQERLQAEAWMEAMAKKELTAQPRLGQKYRHH